MGGTATCNILTIAMRVAIFGCLLFHMHDTALTTHHDTMVCFCLFLLLLSMSRLNPGGCLGFGSGHMTGMYCMFFSRWKTDHCTRATSLDLSSERRSETKSWDDEVGVKSRKSGVGEGKKEDKNTGKRHPKERVAKT